MVASAPVLSPTIETKSWSFLTKWWMTKLFSFIGRLFVVDYFSRKNGVKGFKRVNSVQDEIPSDVTEIVIVRHGETIWNAAGRIQVGERLAKERRPTAVYSSNLRRAKDTALKIAENCFCPQVIEVPELKERHVGSLQGLYWKNAEEMEPQAYRAYFSTQNNLKIPGGGESFNDVCDRSLHALEKIAKNHKGERVIVVSHGGVIKAVYLRITEAESAGQQSNVSVNILHYGGEKKWSIKSWNDVSHLSSVGFLHGGFNGDTKP